MNSEQTGQIQNPMGTGKIFPRLMAMSLPPMISMLIQSLYNIVDSIFVAGLSKDALTAVSFAFPLQNLSLAVAVGFGVGLNAYMARNLGAGDMDKVNSAAAHGVVFTAIHSLLFVIIGLFFAQPFLAMFTDSPDILNMSVSYSRIVICLCFGQLFHIYIEKMFQSVGNMVAPMFLQAIGAIINIILDPIMIFGLLGFPKLGVAGAAIATVIGQMTAFVCAVIMFARSNHGIKVSLKGFKFDGALSKSIYTVAVPSGIMISLPSVLVGLLNMVLTAFGETAVNVFGIYIKLQTFVYMPATGIVQGMRPLISYNYGAGNIKRMRGIVYCALSVCGVIMLLGTVLFLAVPAPILSMFSADEAMYRIGENALRIISLGFLVSTVSVVMCGAFEAVGQGFRSLVISLLRQVVIIPPLAFALSELWELNGVWISFPAAEIAACAAAMYFFLLNPVFKVRKHNDNKS